MHIDACRPGTQAGKPGFDPVVPLQQIKIVKCLTGNALQKKDTHVTPNGTQEIDLTENSGHHNVI